MIKLEHTDALTFLAKVEDKSVSLVLIDPPYDVSRDTNFQAGEPTGKDTDRFRVSMNFGEWDTMSADLPYVIRECHRVLRKGGTFICFYDLYKITTLREWMREAGFTQIRFIEWIKTNPVPLNSKRNYLTNAREVGVCGCKGGSPVFHSEYDNGIYSFPICRDKGRFHPTQKPIALMEALIRKHSNEGDLVLDCFAGSATTAVAAHNSNRDFIGCEMCQEYYDKAMLRLSEL